MQVRIGLGEKLLFAGEKKFNRLKDCPEETP